MQIKGDIWFLPCFVILFHTLFAMMIFLIGLSIKEFTNRIYLVLYFSSATTRKTSLTRQIQRHFKLRNLNLSRRFRIRWRHPTRIHCQKWLGQSLRNLVSKLKMPYSVLWANQYVFSYSVYWLLESIFIYNCKSLK